MTHLCLAYFYLTYPYVFYKCSPRPVACNTPVEKKCVNIFTLWTHNPKIACMASTDVPIFLATCSCCSCWLGLVCHGRPYRGSSPEQDQLSNPSTTLRWRSTDGNVVCSGKEIWVLLSFSLCLSFKALGAFGALREKWSTVNRSSANKEPFFGHLMVLEQICVKNLHHIFGVALFQD